MLLPSLSTPPPFLKGFQKELMSLMMSGGNLGVSAFPEAVDYFAYLYPGASVDRIFSIVYLAVGLFCLLLIIFYSHKSKAYVRINVGFGLFVVSLLVVPLMDVFYIKGRVRSILRRFAVAIASNEHSFVSGSAKEHGEICAPSDGCQYQFPHFRREP
ncbi:hypothetical protein FF1_043672 [Malus domestica]